MTFDEFGAEVNHLFESQLQWSYDSGIFYMNGRDVMCFLVGFLTCMALKMFFVIIEEGRKKK